MNYKFGYTLFSKTGQQEFLFLDIGELRTIKPVINSRLRIFVTIMPTQGKNDITLSVLK